MPILPRDATFHTGFRYRLGSRSKNTQADACVVELSINWHQGCEETKEYQISYTSSKHGISLYRKSISLIRRTRSFHLLFAKRNNTCGSTCFGLGTQLINITRNRNKINHDCGCRKSAQIFTVEHIWDQLKHTVKWPPVRATSASSCASWWKGYTRLLKPLLTRRSKAGQHKFRHRAL
jgi:hypothetical protein